MRDRKFAVIVTPVAITNQKRQSLLSMLLIGCRDKCCDRCEVATTHCRSRISARDVVTMENLFFNIGVASLNPRSLPCRRSIWNNFEIGSSFQHERNVIII